MNLLLLIHFVIVCAFCIKVIDETEDPRKALIYILIAILVPVAGIIFYFIFGTNLRKQKLYRRKLEEDEKIYEELKKKIKGDDPAGADHPEEIQDRFRELVALINREKNLSSSNNEAALLINGDAKLQDVLEAVEKAKHHIHLEYYIYASDDTGRKLGKALAKKAMEGVEVRFIYDDFGSHGLDSAFLKELRDAGVHTAVFYEIKWYILANRVNFRNHRKIIVIDGHIGYVGGINIANEYLNEGPGKDKLFWRDTHLKITGQSVAALQNIFIDDWNFCCNEKLIYSDKYFPDRYGQNFGNKFIQVTASGPDSKHPNILYSLILAIYLAREEVLISTPYFIPEDTFLDALKVADLRGVDVKLLVPYESDSAITGAVSRSYYQALLDAGIEIYRYRKGFLHAKTMVCDRYISIVGTANMDQRSFDLNFEINAVIYNTDFAIQLRDLFYKDLEDAERIEPESWSQRPFLQRIAEKSLRIFSPVL